jgi:hypothetical protein
MINVIAEATTPAPGHPSFARRGIIMLRFECTFEFPADDRIDDTRRISFEIANVSIRFSVHNYSWTDVLNKYNEVFSFLTKSNPAECCQVQGELSVRDP